MDIEMQEDLRNRFTYHAPKDDQPKIYESIRNMGLVFASLVTDLCPEARETSLALAKIEEAVMWANASVARNS